MSDGLEHVSPALTMELVETLQRWDPLLSSWLHVTVLHSDQKSKQVILNLCGFRIGMVNNRTSSPKRNPTYLRI